ncbi:MAG: hypothetical protein ACOYMN_20095 [Roseimicrobium sp.]
MNTDDLIQRHLDGLNTPAEAAQLSLLLETDAVARSRYLDLAGLHAALAADESLRAPRVVLRAKSGPMPAWMRSITQMAAGIVLGALAVGAVWAYATPKMASLRELPLFDASLESVEPMPGSVPQRLGQWAADPCAVVGQKGSVRAREGRSMVQFLAASNTGDHEGSKNMASDLWQVVELPGSGPRTVKVRAWFNAETSKQARFHIAAVAGEGDAASAPQLWEQRYSEGGSLAFARSMTFVDRDPVTWEAGELTLQVPPQARLLVIGIAAYRLPVVAAEE